MAETRGGPSGFPLLPQGNVLFMSLPIGVVNLEALGSAMDTGVAVVRGDGGTAVAVYREGRLTAAHAFEDSARLEGDTALARVQAWPGATVSAHMLDVAALEAVETQLRGEAVYEDLHLAWVDWPRLLEDLRTRLPDFVVTVNSPHGGAVMAVREAAAACTYVTVDAPAGASAESLFGGAQGVLRVIVPARTHAAGELDSALLRLFGRPVPPPTRQHLAAQQEPMAAARLLASLAPELKAVARAHLHRSADRVERIIDAAIANGDSLDVVAASVRSTHVRGVSCSSMGILAGALLAAAQPQPRQGFLPA